MTEESKVETKAAEKPVPVKFNPMTLNFTDFNEEQPSINRWIIVWSNMGSISPNFFISYRDNLGNYDVPQAHKQWAINAWSYIDSPSVFIEPTME